MYCKRHFKKAEEHMVSNEKDNMKNEDFDCNECKLAVDAFNIIREVGKGSFGRVMLIQDTDTKSSTQ